MTGFTDYARFAFALFTILTPFAAVPVFLTLTHGQGPAEKARTALSAVITVVVVLLISAFTGEAILALLGTSLPSFRVGGGLVLLLMALAMLAAEVSAVQQTPKEAAEAETRQAVGVVPLGLPLLAGPGSISSVIIESQRSRSFGHFAALAACIVAVGAVLYVSLRLAEPMGKRLGLIGLNIVNRLFGLLLAAIAVELIAGGLTGLFPALRG